MSGFPNTPAGNSKNEIRKKTDEEGKKRGVSMEKCTEGTKEISLDTLSLNQNTILININWYFFTRYGNNTMKFN